MNNQIDWEQFRVQEPGDQQDFSPMAQSQPNMPTDQFEQYQVQEPEQGMSFMSGLGEAARHATRTGSRVVETIAGLPGDIISGVQGLAIKGAEKIAGKELPFLHERALKARKVPTSSELREKSQQLTKGYTKPQSETEEFFDELASDVTSLAVPVKGKFPLGRALGAAVSGNLAKQGIKAVGGGEEAQEYTKLGSMFLAGMINPNGAKKFTDKLYKKADSLLPANATTDATHLGSRLLDTKRKLLKGGSTPDKTPVLTKIDEILGKIKDGRIKVDELPAFHRDINRVIGDYTTAKGARNFLKGINKDIDSEIARYGRQNPQYAKTYKEANQAFAGLEQSKKISKSLQSALKGIKLKTPIAVVLGIMNPTKAAAVGAAYGGLKSVELMHRITMNPTLRRYYTNAMKESIKGNTANAVKIITKLDEELAKQK